jgi:hypothetical protein
MKDSHLENSKFFPIIDELQDVRLVVEEATPSQNLEDTLSGLPNRIWVGENLWWNTLPSFSLHRVSLGMIARVQIHTAGTNSPTKHLQIFQISTSGMTSFTA